MTQTLITATFRACPRYECVPFDRLSAPERRRADTSSAIRHPYGVVRLRAPGGGTALCVNADIALLFLTLREPGRLPPYFLSALGPTYEATIARLVADGVLEIDIAGGFASGPRGLDALLGDEPAGPRAFETDPLSAAALQLAATGGTTDVAQIAAQLYGYHRIPASPRWRDRLAAPGDVERLLGIGDRRALDFRFAAGWFVWTAPRGLATASYKLYVSPQPGALRDVVAAVIGLTRDRASAMKIGGDVYGVLRPDKLMVYFATFDALAESVQRLRTELAGTPVHGVPFTATIGDDALLSWGVDTPGAAETPPASWRRWVTMRAAEALAIVKRQPSAGGSIFPFLRRRLALDGIDAKNWTWANASRSRGALAAL